jgi:hypothetical protein
VASTGLDIESAMIKAGGPRLHVAYSLVREAET